MKKKTEEQLEDANIFEELNHLNIGSFQLVKRIRKTAITLYKKPGYAISAASESPAEAKAIYRLLGNKKFKKEDLLEVHRKAIIEKIEEEKIKIVLCPQDTSELNFTGLKATEGLGNIGDTKNNAKGLIMHSAICLTEEGVALGVLGQKIWNRPGYKQSKSQEERTIPIEEKESYKWIETINEINKEMPKDVRVITICDREGDIFQLFARANEKKQDFLVRATYNRQTDEMEKSFDTLKEKEIAGEVIVQIPRDTRNGNKERKATLSIRYKKIKIKKPTYLKGYADNVEITMVLAEEKSPPKGIEGISWYLITNVEVTSFEESVRIVKWYVKRWKIERFHFVLKSGMKVEEIQSSTVDRLTKLITLLSLIAIKILAITYFSREYPDTSCEEFFKEDEWKVLYCVVNETTEIPSEPPTIKEAVFYLAKLGGFLGRKSDKEPGAEVIWRGLHDFNVLMRYRKVMSQIP